MSVSTTRSELAPPVSRVDRNGAIPPLESGDRLGREEFERRYDAMPHLKKAELIEGVVYVPSPVRQKYHGEPHSSLIGWLFAYKARMPGLALGDNSTVRLDAINEPQPDCVLFIKPEHQGKVVIDEDGYNNGAPGLVAEVAASSASYDVHDKLAVYQRHGVREYIVWRVFDREVDWYVLRGAKYEKRTAGDDGVLRSTIFPGLWLEPGALLREDHDTLLAVLQRGLDSPEHAAFKAELQRTKVEPAG
jgi:Uma2 family endonuclease